MLAKKVKSTEMIRFDDIVWSLSESQRGMSESGIPQHKRDEIEKSMAGMKGSGELDSGVTSRVLSTLLTWRQETKAPVMFVATANDVASLPSMVYRRGRLTYKSQADIKQLKLLETPKANFATARPVTANANA